jgi:hypothetical protein
MEMPRVEKASANINLEGGVLTVEGRIDFSKYQDLQPVYTEYSFSHRPPSPASGAGQAVENPER